MIVETVITSVPRGLKAGRTGYQPVMRTRGLRDDVLRQLEPLTGYRHVHRQGSGKNPVNYSYRRLASNVGDLAVLGRTVDAGSDFSNRSNKCGHLIAFTADEIGRLSRSTPAALLADNQALFASQWTKGPEERPAPPALAVQPQTPAICTTWQSHFGDGGWAAVVAERARRRQPTLLVAPDSSPQSSELLLRLIREATALLPPADRWAVTFETTVLGASDALIQGTYRGSPEAEATRQGVLVLPLGGPVPPGALQENDLCKLARFGPPQPAAAVPPPVAPTAALPSAGEDFFSNEPTNAGPNSQPPSLPVPAARGTTPFRQVDLADSPSTNYLATIIPVAIILLVIFSLAGYFLVANHDLFLPSPEKPTEHDNAAPNPLITVPPEDVLKQYLTDFHAEPGQKDLRQPSLDVWQKWLTAKDIKEPINEAWVSYANAVLRTCIAPGTSPFAGKWKQKERTFYDTVQNISQLKPTASDLNFLLVAKELTESNEADAFMKAALNAYKESYSKQERSNPEEIIDTAIQANKLHEKLRGFLSQKPHNAGPEDKQLAELVSDYSKATWLPRINGDKNGQQTKPFLLSLRNQITSPDTKATAPTFDKFASFAKEFNKALSDLEAYAKNSKNPNDRTAPSEDTYRTAYGTNLQPTTDGPTVQDLNKAILAIGAVPDTLQPILDAARLIKEWDKLRSDFGKHKYDPAKRKIVLAEGLNFPSGSRGKIKPIFFATTTVASAGSNSWNFLLNEEPSCTVKWEEDGTKLVAEFHKTPKAEVLLRLPLVMQLDSELKNFPKKTTSKRPIEKPLQFATHANPNPTIAAFTLSGRPRHVDVRGGPGSSTQATLADLVAVAGTPCLRWNPKLNVFQKENPPSFSIEHNPAGGLQGQITFQYKTPIETPTVTSESLNASIAYTFQPEQNRLKFEFTETNDLTGLNTDKKLPSTDRSLKRNSVGSNVFSDIAYEVYSSSSGESQLKKHELDDVLIEIVSDHAFGVREDDLFGEKPLYGEKDNGSKLFENNNFSDPDKPGRPYDRTLLGNAEIESLEKRSWEMALASYLIKHSSKFSEKAKLRAAKEKEIKDIEKELEKLNKDPEKNKQDIDEQKETIGGKQKEKRQIDDWFLSGWVKEDLRAIAASVRREAAKKQSGEGRRTEIAARLFLNLRPFLASYLLANDEESKKTSLSSLLSTEIWFQPESDDFGSKFLLAVINPSPLADNTVPPKASDKQTSPDITDQQP